MYDRIVDFCLPERIKKEYMEKFLEKMAINFLLALFTGLKKVNTSV